MPRSICLSAAAVFIAAASVGVAGASLRPPTLSVANVSVAEDGGSIVFTVRISRRTSKRVTVRYATADGSATAGSDYSAARGRIVFNPGERVRRISVPAMDDSAAEDDETFYIVLSRPTNARIAGSQAQGKILANDLPAAFKARATLTGAPGSGAGTGQFTMTLDAAKGEASFTLTVAGSPTDPALAHIHAFDFDLSVVINPLPAKDGSATGTLVLARRLILGIYENPRNYFIQIHVPPDLLGLWTFGGVLSLVAG